jgi:hypothetical protein
LPKGKPLRAGTSVSRMLKGGPLKDAAVVSTMGSMVLRVSTGTCFSVCFAAAPLYLWLSAPLREHHGRARLHKEVKRVHCLTGLRPVSHPLRHARTWIDALPLGLRRPVRRFASAFASFTAIVSLAGSLVTFTFAFGFCVRTISREVLGGLTDVTSIFGAWRFGHSLLSISFSSFTFSFSF